MNYSVSFFNALFVAIICLLYIIILLLFQNSNLLHFDFLLLCSCAVVVIRCIVTQMNYLNKSLDLFNTARVTPIYYVFFTTFVIIASVILFRDWKGQSIGKVLSQICGFLTVFIGIYILQMSKSEQSPKSEGFQAISTNNEEPDNSDVEEFGRSVAEHNLNP